MELPWETFLRARDVFDYLIQNVLKPKFDNQFTYDLVETDGEYYDDVSGFLSGKNHVTIITHSCNLSPEYILITMLHEVGHGFECYSRISRRGLIRSEIAAWIYAEKFAKELGWWSLIHEDFKRRKKASLLTYAQ